MSIERENCSNTIFGVNLDVSWLRKCEIQDFLDDIKKINDYIKKNPAELIYAMTRYPKDDPRLAQLNFKMDQMKAASDEYVELFSTTSACTQSLDL